MALRAIRGATQLDVDERDHLIERVIEMLTAVMKSNGLVEDDFVSILFTATTDVGSEFPAAAARTIGFADTPLIDARPMEIDGSMPRLIRMIAHVESDRSKAAVEHIYLHGAVQLRRDLVQQAEGV